MSNAASESTPPGPDSRLRVWPGLLIVVLQWLSTFGGAIVAPGTPIQFFGMMGGPLIGTILVLLWWMFGSRADKRERRIGLAVLILGYVAANVLAHESMQMVLVVHGLPFVCLAFVGWAVWSRNKLPSERTPSMVASVVVACLVWTLVRTDGVTGDLGVDFAWRWASSAEERYLAARSAAPTLEPQRAPAVLVETVPDWPGFRGANRDGVVRGVRLDTDWSASPPALLWKRPIGPGWSSFAIASGRLYTQEQQGEEEVVTCHAAATGELIWQHRDTARFWESMAGAGPRATPTLTGHGRVVTLGATGILNSLDVSDGSVVWSRNVADDSKATIPDWGFASSPLVVGDLVIVHTGAPDGKAIGAYDRATGEPRWFAAAEGASYSSGHLATVQGTEQVILLTAAGAVSVAPEDGSMLWNHAWPMSGSRIVQPGFAADGDVLIGTGFGMGLRRIAVDKTDAGWTTAERWTSLALKPYFNDFVVHRGHVYGFDGRILACVSVEDGERKWKGGRYGHGQLLLLPEQDLLLVLSEQGEIALVSADSAQFSEVARAEALEGKTWNHPVLVDDVLYMRNGNEMAAFRLPVSADPNAS